MRCISLRAEIREIVKHSGAVFSPINFSYGPPQVADYIRICKGEAPNYASVRRPLRSKNIADASNLKDGSPHPEWEQLIGWVDRAYREAFANRVSRFNNRGKVALDGSPVFDWDTTPLLDPATPQEQLFGAGNEAPGNPTSINELRNRERYRREKYFTGADTFFNALNAKV